MKRYKTGLLLNLCLVLAAISGTVTAYPAAAQDNETVYLPVVIWSGGGPLLEGCQVFPADHIWNTRIDSLPLDTHSASYINTMGASTGLHPDFGAGTWEGFPIGIPYTVVSSIQPRLGVVFDYAGESDPGPYPIPGDVLIEGNPDGDGDRHALILDEDACILYELFALRHTQSGGWAAGSGAIFDLNGYALRPDGWTSADAAGMAILPGLVRFEEAASGRIAHAIRFTVPQTRHAYVWPARHYASDLIGLQYPPMGARFRLKASVNISTYPPLVRTILQAMKEYGIILADNGSAWYISGVPDDRWDNDDLRLLGNIKGSDFEAVDSSSLILDPDSGQAAQP